MNQFLMFRLVRGIITILVAVTVTFLVLRVMPGDPTTMMLDPRMTEEARQQLLKDFGLDKDLATQYFIYLKQLFVHFDLGISFVYRSPVFDVILARLPWTLLLMGGSMIVTTSIGIPLGVNAAYHKGTLLDRFISMFSTFGIAVFIPWLGIVLLYCFGYKIPLFPIGGARTPGIEGWDHILDVAHHLILPMLTLTIINLANSVLFMRARMVDVLNEDYIRTARAKGLRERVVVWRHAVRNGMLPTVTMIGLQVGSLLGGAILTETVFAYPGIGRLIYEAVKEHDYPVLQGTFLMLAITVVVVNLVTDLIYTRLDPKITIN
ncbi:ABC transporter permease [Brevibacillus fluminis]|uniref:ABC transporter permease n=1 Tax=Brevibacillus fluminis TaxID=511487 RepID=A0A3M8DHU1_9BACL|nr:ABC transporter permease [Brevibacillus fluminis]RNB87690.1 ABC transporter permease [Brevibacillus fluminis]